LSSVENSPQNHFCREAVPQLARSADNWRFKPRLALKETPKSTFSPGTSSSMTMSPRRKPPSGTRVVTQQILELSWDRWRHTVLEPCDSCCDSREKEGSRDVETSLRGRPVAVRLLALSDHSRTLCTQESCYSWCFFFLLTSFWAALLLVFCLTIVARKTTDALGVQL
jgi:hypothetical protein